MKTFVSTEPAEIFRVMEASPCYPGLKAAGLGSFPMTEEMLFLLKKANPLPQEYHFIEEGKRFAFFTVYENRMDLLTFGKASWYMRIKTIAYPCSLSCGGYLTNDLPMMLRYIKSLKGGKLILNTTSCEKVRGMGCGETLPTCRLTIRPEHVSAEAYLDSLRSTYRRRMKLALKWCGDVAVSEYGNSSGTGDAALPDVYPLYCQTYEKSEYKLERLEQSFFEETDGVRLVFFRKEKPVGFVLLKRREEELIFLFCGMDYTGENHNADLYYTMLYHIVKYGIEHRCKTIDFGQTSENTKLKFGAELERRYFYAHHSNPLLNLIAIVGKPVLEYHYRFPDYRVFKDV